MKRRILFYSVVFAAIAAAVVLMGMELSSASAADSSPSPSPSPSATASPSPTATPTPPAPAKVVKSALKKRARAVKVWRKWNRARRCFAMSHKPFASPKPPRSASAAVWKAARAEWIKKLGDLQARFGRLRDKMVDPGGGGWERWRPLVRWIWPKRCVNTVVQIMRYESGGRPRVLCGNVKLPKGAGDGKPDERAGGLMMLKPAPRHWADPEFNLLYAYVHKYLAARKAGGSGWEPWAGCLAFR